MVNDILKEARQQMGKTAQNLKKELSGLRAGRANPQLIEKINVDYYGVSTPLNQLGNFSVPEPRLLVISLWDAKLIPDVEKEIMKSDLGITPSNDGKVIRLVFPELTEERRKELVKLANKLGEEAKVATRMIRRNANDQLKKLEKSSEISEDDEKDGEDQIQEITDEHIDEIDSIIKEKESEIMEV